MAGESEDSKEVGTLKRVSTIIQTGGALVANVAAGFGWIEKHLHLFPLPAEQRVAGVLLSISLSVFGILILWWWVLDPGKDILPRSRVLRLLKAAAVALAGFLSTATIFNLLDRAWKIVAVETADLIIDIAMPLVFGIGHGFLSVFLCALGLAIFAPGVGILSQGFGFGANKAETDGSPSTPKPTSVPPGSSPST